MTPMLFPAGLLALLWGLVWAGVLWGTGWGRWVRLRRTWLSVVIGVGGDLLVMGLVMGLEVWLAAWLIVAASAVGIVGLCWVGEYREHREEMASFDSAASGRSAQDGGGK